MSASPAAKRARKASEDERAAHVKLFGDVMSLVSLNGAQRASEPPDRASRTPAWARRRAPLPPQPLPRPAAARPRPSARRRVRL